MSDIRNWQVTKSEYLVSDRWIRLRADACVTPEGHVVEPYYVLEYPDWITCVVVDKQLDVLLVRQYRHGAGKAVLEIVAGTVDGDEAPDVTARREVAEEVGYTGGTLFKVGSYYANPANSTNTVHAYLLVGGDTGQAQNLDNGEEGLQIERLPLKELWRRFTDPEGAEVYQGFHLASLYLAERFIRTSDEPQLQTLKASIGRT